MFITYNISAKNKAKAFDIVRFQATKHADMLVA